MDENIFKILIGAIMSVMSGAASQVNAKGKKKIAIAAIALSAFVNAVVGSIIAMLLAEINASTWLVGGLCGLICFIGLWVIMPLSVAILKKFGINIENSDEKGEER